MPNKEELDNPLKFGYTNVDDSATQTYYYSGSYGSFGVGVNDAEMSDIYILYHEGRHALSYIYGDNLVDFATVVLHEMGHALGWYGHNSSTEVLMHHDVLYCASEITDIDVEHIMQLYE